MEWIEAGLVEEIEQAGVKTLRGGIAVFAHEDGIYAVENRCPHMGFPLHVGSLCDGILTCHWHHARFDVCSGGTLDPWADDVPTHDVRLEGGKVYVNPQPKQPRNVARHLQRLREGLEQNIGLIIAKSVIALQSAGVDEATIAQVGIDYGTTQRASGWGSGLTILTAMVNLLPKLDAYGRILALFHGLVHVARDCAGQPPRRMLAPLPESDVTLSRLAAWYRQCIEVRDTDGAERVLLAAIEKGADNAALADMMLTAVTDHVYLDGGHTFDFHNKAFEVLERYERDSGYGAMHSAESAHARRKQILTSLVPLLSHPTRSEEQQNWQSPVNLVTPMAAAFAELPHLSLAPTGGDNAMALDAETFIAQVLSEQPAETVQAISEALRGGVSPAYVAQLVTLAAAERIARFHVQNDFGDWISVLHTFTHAHAVHQRLQRKPDSLAVRAIYHAAMRIYLDRFLNIPSAPRPSVDRAKDAGYQTDLNELLALTDQRQQVAAAANWVANYLQEQGDVGALWNALGQALLREDAEFHSFQMVEAVAAEYDDWNGLVHPFAARAKEILLIAITRYLAAHAPTARETPHVARIAWRLHRGERLFEEA